MTTEPVPGATPIPVIIINPETHASSTELWIVGTNIALTTVTLLVVLIEIHKDHEVIKSLLGMIARLLPPYRRAPLPDEPDDFRDTDDIGGVPIPTL